MPSNKIKDEFQKINDGFDQVQQDMDAKPNSSIAQVNTLELGADDTITIEAGTGITIVNVPEEKKIRIVATGESTPGAHGEEHNHDGSDPIPELVQLEEDVEDLIEEFNEHKTESVSKVVMVEEPYNQVTKTTINLGFRPKNVTIASVIRATKYESLGFTDGVIQYSRYTKASDDMVNVTDKAITFQYDSGLNQLTGLVTFIETGIEITWTLTGTLTGASGNRRLIISAMAHGEV